MNDIDTLERLIDQILAGIQEVLASGEVLSDEFQGMIAEEIRLTLARIDELRAAGQPQEPGQPPEPEAAPEAPAPPAPFGGPIPELEPAPHESSNINAFRYDPKTEQLYVKFQGKYPQQNGPVYQYKGVPKFIYDVFSRGAVGPKTSGRNAWHRWKEGVTPSHGAAMFALIKQGGYPYQRMT